MNYSLVGVLFTRESEWGQGMDKEQGMGEKYKHGRCPRSWGELGLPGVLSDLG